MNYLIAYDIQNDRLRTQVANKLLYFGLVRVQYSVFMGNLRPALKKQARKWLEEKKDKDFDISDRLMILPLHDSLLAKLELLGEHPFDVAEVFGKRHTLII